MNKRLRYILLLIMIGCHQVKAQNDIVVTKTHFSSDYREYSPVFFNEHLVYCGDSRGNEALTYVEEKSGNQLTDLYKINLSDSTAKPTVFSKALKTSFHDGPACFSQDGNTVYFTRSQLITKKLKNSVSRFNKFGIYKATFNGEEWVDIKACSFNSPDYNVGHPTLSEDGKTLFVVSDKPEGFGGSDIYYAEIDGDVVGELKNLGKRINTSFNETFPRIANDGKIYFASNRPGGRGGLDVYKSWRIGENWVKPIALDTFVNSEYDDFGLVYNQDETVGYFCSNRLGSDDIFKITFNYPSFENCIPYVKELLCYEFYEEATLNADSVSMVYEWDFGDGHSERSLETYHCYEKPGKYEVKLNIMDPMVGKTFVNEATYELEIEEINQPAIICPDTISINQGFKLQVKQRNWKDFTIENFYVDYGDSTRIRKNPNELYHYRTAGIRSIRVLITASLEGSKELKKQCFVKAIFVKQVESQLSETEFIDQLTYAGFNSDKIENIEDSFYSLQLMTSDSSVIQNEAVLQNYYGKAFEYYDEVQQKYLYIYGKAQGPFEFIALFREAHKNGFSEAVVSAYEEGKVKVPEMAMTYNNESGEVNIVLENIQFKYDGTELDQNSLEELDKLIDFLKSNPDMKIEIGAHTDGSRRVEKAKASFRAKGIPYTRAAHDKMSSSYNLGLSQKRANNVVKYIVKKGVSKSRLKAKGYGESVPLAPNFNEDGTDNLDGQAKNRRVEFRILN